MDATVVGHHTAAGSLGCREQSAFQRGVVAGLYREPVKSSRAGQPNILGCDTRGNAERSGDLFIR